MFATGSCSGSPGPEWADSGCTFMHVGHKCTAPCASGQQGVGYVADCTIAGWHVMARDCSDVVQPPPRRPCIFLPTPNAPAGSKGWAADCAGRGDGERCQAACDGLNSYFGRGYTGLCQDGQWIALVSGTGSFAHAVPHVCGISWVAHVVALAGLHMFPALAQLLTLLYMLHMFWH
jgi:hypothetical protein